MGLVRLEELSRASGGEAAAFIAEVDPAGLVEAVRSAPDSDLVPLVERDEIRTAVTAGVIQRLAEFVVPAQAEGVSGSYRIDLHHRGRVVERHAFAVADGTFTATLDVTDDHPADLVLRTSALSVIRIVTGQLNAGLAYLDGSLVIEGDALLALALAGMFPAADGSGPVDPRALDPVDVARVVAIVSSGHLRSVMSSGMRHVVLDEIFRRIPDFVNERRASGLRVTIGFRLTGRPDGEIDRYVVTMADGRAVVASGADADAIGADGRNATVTCDAGDFLRLVTGQISAVTGFLRGQLKVRGDKAAALRLNAAFDIPSAVA